MARIERDERHPVLNLVHVGEIGERVFPTWDRRYLNNDSLRSIQPEDVLEGVLMTIRKGGLRGGQDHRAGHAVGTPIRLPKVGVRGS